MPATPKSPMLTELKAFLTDARVWVMLNYALLFFMVMTVGATGVLALLVATFAREKSPEWLHGHYDFQVRTFWIGVVPSMAAYMIGQYLLKVQHAGPLTLFLVIGPVLAWVASRVAMGFNHVLNKRPYPNPKSWLV